MATPFIGEIRMFAGTFAPSGWAFCNGGVMAISQNQALFSLIGTTYGGDGVTTFALPDLRSRVPVHVGSNGTSSYVLGESGGLEAVTVLAASLPSHTHAMQAATGTGTLSSPANSVLAASSSLSFYAADPPAALMNPAAVNMQGGSQSHNNVQPFLGIVFILALFGVFPSRN